MAMQKVINFQKYTFHSHFVFSYKHILSLQGRRNLTKTKNSSNKHASSKITYYSFFYKPYYLMHYIIFKKKIKVK
jgi:hypothetical protein